MELGKVPPHDEDAEQAVLGSMLTDNDAVMAAVEVLKEDAFYREDNKIIYQAILNLYSKSEPIDIITLKDELESMGKFEQVGGFEYLASLPDKVPTTANVQKYIKLSGYIWKDVHEGKQTVRNDLYKDGDYDENDESFNGITVRLKDKDGNTLKETKSSERGLYNEINGGEYIFEDIEIKKLGEYYIEFEYDGLIYQSVAININKNNGSK